MRKLCHRGTEDADADGLRQHTRRVFAARSANYDRFAKDDHMPLPKIEIATLVGQCAGMRLRPGSESAGSHVPVLPGPMAASHQLVETATLGRRAG